MEANELDSYINEEVPVPEEDEAKALHKKKLVMVKMITLLHFDPKSDGKIRRRVDLSF